MNKYQYFYPNVGLDIVAMSCFDERVEKQIIFISREIDKYFDQYFYQDDPRKEPKTYEDKHGRL